MGSISALNARSVHELVANRFSINLFVSSNRCIPGLQPAFKMPRRSPPNLPFAACTNFSYTLCEMGPVAACRPTVKPRSSDRDYPVEDFRALFIELWDAGQVLTREKLDALEKTCDASKRRAPDPEKEN